MGLIGNWKEWHKSDDEFEWKSSAGYYRRSAKKGFWREVRILIQLVLVVVFLGSLVCGAVTMGVGDYRVKRDITGYISRASDAPNAEDFIFYLEQAKASFEMQKTIDGYGALVFQKQENDLKLHYRDLCSLLKGAEKAFVEDEAIAERLVVMDYREAATRLYIKATSQIWWVRYGWWGLILLLIGITGLLTDLIVAMALAW